MAQGRKHFCLVFLYFLCCFALNVSSSWMPEAIILRQCIDALAGAINKFSGGVVLATKLTLIRLYQECVTKELYEHIISILF